MSEQNSFLAALSDQDRSRLIEAIDESPYSFEEWKEALSHFQSWLDRNHRKKTFSDQVEYLSCCIQGSSNTGKLLTLSDLLQSYLDTFGVR